MDPTNNPMQNMNSVSNDGVMSGAGAGGVGMGGVGVGSDMSSMMNGGMNASMGGAVVGGASMAGVSAMGAGVPAAGGMPMVGGDVSMAGTGIGGMPTGAAASAPMGGVPIGGGMAQQVGGPMSPGQMFQAGGVAAPMGALGGVPGDLSSSNSPLLGATDPLTMPAPPKAPDPVEVELNAPFKAAGPVPGSIGSAISMPGDPNQQVPNVAFNDPAMMAPNSSMMPKKKSWSARLGMDGGKKMDKKTMIIIGAIAAVVVVAIVAVVMSAL